MQVATLPSRYIAPATLFRVDPNPGYRVYPDVVFDGETGLAMLFGGEWYDEDRRPQGDVGDMWAYQHIDRDK